MSLINQVLTDLEKRGASPRSDGSTVRPVHVQGRRRSVIVPATILLLAGMAGLWAGLRHKTEPHPVSSQPTTAEQTAAAPSTQVPAPRDHAGSDESDPDPAGTSQVADRQAAMRMSLELNSVPLPSSLRDMRSLQANSAPALAAPQTTATASQAATDDGSTLRRDAIAPAGAEASTLALPVQGDTIRSGNAVSGIDKRIRRITLQEQAENEFRKANELAQQGSSEEAIAGYRSALRLDAGHEAARQAMVGLLLDGKRNADAEQALKEGLDADPKQSRYAMLLARLQVERNALPQALETLQTTLPHADRQADYQAFIAAVLQRLDRHKEAVDHYQAALRLSPNSGVWLMGLGISLQAEKRNKAARTAFRQAVDTQTLSPELQAFVTRRLRELSP